MNKSVTVVIPTFNRSERLLREAIDSALAQTIEPMEVIVVDDGSDVPIAPSLSDYGDRVTFIYQENTGVGLARDNAVAHATGEFLAFLDSDDVWVPNRLEVQFDAFAADPTLDAVFGHVTQFFDEETSPEFRKRFAFPEETMASWLTTSMLIRRDAFERIGAFGKDRSDVDWRMRAVDGDLRETMLSDVLLWRRIHHGNLGLVNRDEANRIRVLSVKAHLDRQRAKNKSMEIGSDL